MARRPRRADVSRARTAQARAEPPIRFVEDFEFVEIMQTTEFKAGRVLDDPPLALRLAALGSGKAVVVKRGE